MLLRLNPHRPPRDKRPQWADVPWAERNWAQKFASITGVTPPDAVSVMGVSLRVKASMELAHAGELTRKQRLKWIGCLAVGNLCDLADGLLAERLKVKHHGGAALDALGDGVGISSELIGLRRGGLLSDADFYKLAGIKVSNGVATYLTQEAAAGEGPVRESNASGKIFTAAAGAGIVLRAAVRAASAPDGSVDVPVDIASHEITQNWAIAGDRIAGSLLTVAAAIGAHASVGYWNSAVQSWGSTPNGAA